jgi:hypothetical protein
MWGAGRFYPSNASDVTIGVTPATGPISVPHRVLILTVPESVPGYRPYDFLEKIMQGYGAWAAPVA